MVTFLEKPTKSEGFEQIVDFLSAHTLRRDLRLADEEGVDCLLNSTIFENLKLIGPKTIAWNELRSTMPSESTEHVVDEAIYKELDDILVRVATTASSLEAKQYSGNINKSQSKGTSNEASSQGTTSGGGLSCQEAMRDTIAQTK
nr:hypothetical protein [Tanacetum cinerariifolium]